MKRKTKITITNVARELLVICLITLGVITFVSCVSESSIAPKPVAAADSDPAPVAVASGTITGTVRNAQDGSVISGVLVWIQGAVATSATTDGSGNYTLNQITPGSVTVLASKTNYANGRRDATVTDATTTSGVDLALVENSYATGKFIITLEWGSTPLDLDLHLYIPDVTDDSGTPYDSCLFNTAGVSGNTCHIRYDPNKGDNDGTLNNQPFAGLDNDEASGYGPETIAIWHDGSGSSVPKSNNTYRLSVHNNSADPDGGNDSSVLAGSGAVIKIYNEGTLIETVPVPSSFVSTGLWWHVCDMDNGTWDCSMSAIGDQPVDSDGT